MAKELPPNLVSSAYSTAMTSPCLLKTGPPLPPWVVAASNTMSVRVTSPMWPWVVVGRMRPWRLKASAPLAVDQEAGAVVVHGVDRSLGIGRGRAVVSHGLAVSAVAIAERPALLVVEGIGGLDQADAGPVVLDDALARGPLALQRREPRPGGLQLPLEGHRLFSRR